MAVFVSVSGGPKEHLPGASSSSDQSESSSGEHHALDGGSQDLSHSEHDDSSEKLGLISEAASPPGSPEQRPPDLVSAISGWVQFEDDAPWASSSPPPKEAGGTGRPGEGLGRIGMEICASQGCFPKRGLWGCQDSVVPAPGPRAWLPGRQQAEVSLGLTLHHVEGSMCSGPFLAFYLCFWLFTSPWKDAYGFIYYRLELYLLST